MSCWGTNPLKSVDPDDPFEWGHTIMKFVTAFSLLIVLSSCAHDSAFSDLSQRIRTELPVGSTKAQVISFLDANHIDHSTYIDLDERPAYRTETTFLSHELDGKREQIKGMIVVMLRHTRSNWLADVDQQIHFYFDSKGALVASTFREVKTGL
jgi:hypothetical protein